MKKVLHEMIDTYKDIPLSDADLLSLVKGKANVISNTKLHDYVSIDECLSPYGAFVLLYETKPHFGHFTCVIKTTDCLENEMLEFFDPYGGIKDGQPDAQLRHIPDDFRKESNQEYPYLTRLLIESPYECSYNEYQFQELDPEVKSCGRWCALRIMLKDLCLEEFKELFFGKYSDDIATYLTIDERQLQNV